MDAWNVSGDKHCSRFRSVFFLLVVTVTVRNHTTERSAYLQESCEPLKPVRVRCDLGEIETMNMGSSAISTALPATGRNRTGLGLHNQAECMLTNDVVSHSKLNPVSL